jgi:hypothetical protein
MWLKEILQRFVNPLRIARPAPAQFQRRRSARLFLECLEDRTLPSNYTASGLSDLVADINAANQAGGSNTITLAANTTFDLVPATGVTATGRDLLPVIAANDNLTIVGKGADTISGDTAGRLFDVAAGATLTLSNLILSKGFAIGSGGAIYNQGTVVLNGVNALSNSAEGDAQGNAAGGAIWSNGTLTLQNTTVQHNSAFASSFLNGSTFYDGTAYGGGIWSSGSLTLAKGTVIESNEALGYSAGTGGQDLGQPGGNAFGGGLYIAEGTAVLTGATVDSNLAQGGAGSFFSRKGYVTNGGSGYGGGLYVARGATVTLSGDTVTSNGAAGDPGKANGYGDGGGLFIAAHATVYLDAFTLANALNNTADKHPDIDGSYVLQS